MSRGILEARQGGRCYTEHEDGSEVDWGTVLAWEPPRRLVFSWQIAADWKCESDLSKASEVEILFTQAAAGRTRVDLEHRYFDRMGVGGEAMRAGVNGEGGWGSLLEMFSQRVLTVTRKES
jgi:uncharacterized protein YndB with AHSA1/START domain